jgi:hypothetical protein
MPPRQIVSRPAGYPNSIFRESLSQAGYAQMNDWSRLARLTQTTQKVAAGTNCRKYAPDEAHTGLPLSGSVGANRASVGRRRGDNSVCP